MDSHRVHFSTNASEVLNQFTISEIIMNGIRVSRKSDLKPGDKTPGLTREIAIEGKDAVIIHSTAEGGIKSAWHHHGEHNTYGYVISGTLRFEYGPGGKQFVDINPGEYFYVPPLD